MEKTYYKIELRMGKEEMEFPTKEISNYYYSNGFAIVSGNYFEGSLTDDYIQGNMEEKELCIKVYEFMKMKTFSNNFADIVKISQNNCYLLVSKHHIATLYFIEKIDNIEKQKEIEKEIKQVKITRSKP